MVTSKEHVTLKQATERERQRERDQEKRDIFN